MENVTKDSAIKPNFSGELTGHVDQKPGVAKQSQTKETKTTLIQATIQRMLSSSDKSKSAKSSKASSISSSDTDDERQEVPGGIKSLNVNRSGATPKPRFQKGMNGCHYHNLQHKKFHRMQKNLFGHAHNPVDAKSNPTVNEKPYLKNSNLEASLTEKYGKCQEVIGKGAFGIVRVAHKVEPKMHGEKLFAVKEFKRKNNEPLKRYIKRLTSEFCISSSLRHINVIDTLDLLQDTQGNYCEVMEFCTGGDLYSLIISADGLEQEEADCFFGQLINGVKYLHDNGVAHRDLKPENILLTSTGCLKITDFGNSECFRMAWETKAHLTRGICGSEPYIAPEEFTDDWFDPRLVDVWACGIIYMSMITGRQLWRVAKAQEDSNFNAYLEARAHDKVLEPFSGLSNSRRRMIGKIIEPDPKQRITAEKITKDSWFLRTNICHRSSNNANNVAMTSTRNANTTCSIVNTAGRHATTMNNAALANA